MISLRKNGKKALYQLIEIDSEGNVVRERGFGFLVIHKKTKDDNNPNALQLLVLSTSDIQPSNGNTIQAKRHLKPWNKKARTLTIDVEDVEQCHLAGTSISFIRRNFYRCADKVKLKYQLMYGRIENLAKQFKERKIFAVFFDGKEIKYLKFKPDDDYQTLHLKSKTNFDLKKAKGAPVMVAVGSGGVDQVIGVLDYNDSDGCLYPVIFRDSTLGSTFTQVSSTLTKEHETTMLGAKDIDKAPDLPSTSQQHLSVEVHTTPLEAQKNEVQEPQKIEENADMPSEQESLPAKVSSKFTKEQETTMLGAKDIDKAPDLPSTSQQHLSVEVHTPPLEAQKNEVLEPQKIEDNADIPSQQESFPAKDVEMRSKNLKSSTKRQTEFQPKFMADFSFSSAKTDDIFTNLTIRRRKKPLQGHGHGSIRSEPETSIRTCLEIFSGTDEDSLNPKSILVIGKPGIGKTLFCQKLVRDWTNNLFQNELNTKAVDFDFVYLLTFRQLNLLGNQELNLREVLNRSPLLDEHSNIDEALFKNIIEHPEKTLFILDGYDEYAHRYDIETNFEQTYANTDPQNCIPVAALLSKLLRKKIFSDATILVTSRPGEADGLAGINFDAVVEIAGFSPEHVKEFVGKYFQSKPKNISEDILGHIVKNENLLSLAHIPMMCFLMCWCLDWHMEFKVEKELPDTVTDLYSEILRIFEIKHHSKSEYRSTEIPRQFKVPSVVKSTLEKLSELAGETILQKKILFQEDDLEKFCISSEEVEVLKSCGLLTCGPGFQKSPFLITRDFCFSHLTLHEYLAACQFVKNNEFSSRFYELYVFSFMVFQFMAGLLGREKKEELMEQLITAMIMFEADSERPKRLAICLYEYRDKQFGIRMIKKFHPFMHEGGSLFYGELSAVEGVAVSFLLDLISEYYKNYEVQKQNEPFLIHTLEWNLNTVAAANRIFDSLKNEFCPITILQFYGFIDNHPCWRLLCETLPFTNITTLRFARLCWISDEELEYLSVVLWSIINITTIIFYKQHTTNETIQNFIDTLPSNITAIVLDDSDYDSTSYFDDLGITGFEGIRKL